MTITSVVLAFIAGMVGAGVGGAQAFVLCGIVGLAGTGAAAALPALGLGVLIGDVAFGVWFHPALAFFGSLVAYAYSAKRGYIESGKAICVPLSSIQKPDALLIGGVGGMIGYIAMVLLTSPDFLGIKADGGAISIVVLSIFLKLIFDRSLFGKVPAEIKARGGRFAIHNGNAWLSWQRLGLQKYVLGVTWGSASAAAAYALFQQEATAAFAPYIGFFIGAFMFLWLTVGHQSLVVHHPSLTASYAVQMLVVTSGAAGNVLLSEAVVWGAAVGVSAMFIADFCADCVYVYGDVHFDPPACSIFILSFIIMTFLTGTPVAKSILLPVVLLILWLAVAMWQSRKPKIDQSQKSKSAVSASETVTS